MLFTTKLAIAAVVVTAGAVGFVCGYATRKKTKIEKLENILDRAEEAGQKVREKTDKIGKTVGDQIKKTADAVKEKFAKKADVETTDTVEVVC